MMRLTGSGPFRWNIGGMRLDARLGLLQPFASFLTSSDIEQRGKGLQQGRAGGQ